MAEPGRVAAERLVRDALAARVGADVANDLPATTPFEDVGIDSLDLLVVVAQLERLAGRGGMAPGGLWEVADCVESLVALLSAKETGT